MTRSTQDTAAKRSIEMLRAAALAAANAGVGGQQIEDDQFLGDSIVLFGEKVANFGLCSYLGLGTDDRLVEGAIDATRRFGTSYSSSIAYTSLGLYGDLTERLSAMFGAPVILAGTTTLGHLAALPVLVNRGDIALVDGQAHASILAVKPSLVANGAHVRTIPHNDMGELERRLIDSTDVAAVWYLTDGVFSMHGDSAPAEQIHEMLAKYPNFHVYCDDAHGFGWDGAHGIGNYLKRVGWHDRVVVSAGMAKSFGTMGGIVATPNQDFIDLIKLTGSPLVFGGPIPPPILGASIASADIHLSSEHAILQAELNSRISHVNEFSSAIGLPLMVREHNPLWFMEVGAFKTTFAIAQRMRELGFYVNPAVFPVVPRGRGGIRFTVTNYNSRAQIEGMLTCLNKVRLELLSETEVIVDLTDQRVSGGAVSGQEVPDTQS